MRKNNKKGFTMAELLIVVAIIAVLSSVAFIAVAQHRKNMAQLEADGFAGNIFLKTAEGVALVIMKTIKQKLTESTAAKLGALLAKNKLYELKSELNYSEEGGAPILGISKPVLKAHGSASAEAFCNAVYQAIAQVESDIAADIAANIDKMKVGRETE